MLGGCEVQTNWYKVPNDKRFDRLVGIGEDQRHIAAHNIHNKTRYASLEALSLLPMDKSLALDE